MTHKIPNPGLCKSPWGVPGEHETRFSCNENVYHSSDMGGVWFVCFTCKIQLNILQ